MMGLNLFEVNSPYLEAISPIRKLLNNVTKEPLGESKHFLGSHRNVHLHSVTEQVYFSSSLKLISFKKVKGNVNVIT
jgi:hypothetical protein